MRRLTGNPVEVREANADEAAAKASGRSHLWADIRREGRVAYGLDLAELRKTHIA